MIITVETPEEALKKAQHKLNELLSEHSFTSILLLVSGGSTFAVLSHIEKEVLGPHVTLGVLDEQFDADAKINNCAQLMELSFYHHAMHRGAHIIDTRVREGETLEQLAARFESDLHTWRTRNDEGVVFIIQGIGADGHTAGIMPYSEDQKKFNGLFDTPDRFVTGYDAGEKNVHPLRITITLPFLRQWVDHSICYVGGDDKKDGLARVRARIGTLAETPGRIIKEMKDVSLFTTEKLCVDTPPNRDSR